MSVNCSLEKRYVLTFERYSIHRPRDYLDMFEITTSRSLRCIALSVVLRSRVLEEMGGLQTR